MSTQKTNFPTDAADAAPDLAVTGVEQGFIIVNDAVAATLESARGKLTDAMTPGFQAEFDPAEADAAGAFQEDALSEADAMASTHD